MKQKDFYKSKAWQNLAKLVKLVFSNADGLTQCWTCDKFLMIGTSDCHAGHYIPAHQHRATALEFENCGIQCKKCNTYEGGKPERMRAAIDKHHGNGTADMLHIKKHNFMKLDRFALDTYANMYESLYKQEEIKKAENLAVKKSRILKN